MSALKNKKNNLAVRGFYKQVTPSGGFDPAALRVRAIGKRPASPWSEPIGKSVP
jgi:hypothetical protein